MPLTVPAPPRVTRENVEYHAEIAWHAEYPDEPLPAVYVLDVRGYRKTTMGDPTRNDVNLWDDLSAIVSPTIFLPENSNLDPSKLGWNAAIGKPYCMLQPGVWWFYYGPHKGQLPAFRQADDAQTALKLGIPHGGKFFVERCYGHADRRNYTEWGHQQINRHPGGLHSTSSWACLTLPPADGVARNWLQTAKRQLDLHGQKLLPSILIEGPVC